MNKRRYARLLLVLVVPLLVLATSIGTGNAHLVGTTHTTSFVSTSYPGLTIILVGTKGIATLGPNTHVLIDCAYYVSSGSAGTGLHTVYMRGRVPLFANAPTSFVLTARTGISSVRWDPYGTVGTGPCATGSSGWIHTGVAVVAP